MSNQNWPLNPIILSTIGISCFLFSGFSVVRAQDCSYLSFANISNLLNTAASQGSSGEYEIAVLAVIEFREACPEFGDRVDELLAVTDKEFVDRQMASQYGFADNEVSSTAKASDLLLRSNNSKILGLIAFSVGSATFLYSIPFSLLCTGVGGISYLRSISLDRKAAKQLSKQGQ